MADRAQRWASSMSWTSRNRVFELMDQTNALVDPRDVENSDVHLLDPPAHGSPPDSR